MKGPKHVVETSYVKTTQHYKNGDGSLEGCRQYSDSLLAGRSGDRIPVRARFSAPVQTGPGTHPASYTKGYRVFPGGKAAEGWG